MAEKSRDKSCGVCLQDRLGKTDSRAKLWHPSSMPTCILRDLHPTMAIKQGSGQERRQRMPGVPHEIQLHNSKQILDRRKRGKGAGLSTTSEQHWPGNLADISTKDEENVQFGRNCFYSHTTSSSNRFHRLHSILDELHSRQSTQLERRNTRRLREHVDETSLRDETRRDETRDVSSSISMVTSIPDKQSRMEHNRTVYKNIGTSNCRFLCSFIFDLYYIYMVNL